VIPEIDIWRVANLMLKRYGDEADIESAIRAEELAAITTVRLSGGGSSMQSRGSRAQRLPEHCTEWDDEPG
jgi:hypothetical protein